MRRTVFSKVLSNFKALTFVLPALFFYIIFSIRPIIDTIQISFHVWNGVDPYMEFVGFANYVDILTDAVFLTAFQNNIKWIIGTVLFPVMIGLILAVILSQKFIRLRLLFRVAYFMPVVISLVAVSIIWRWIYNPIFGILNRFLNGVGLGFLASDWLGDSSIALFSVLAAGSWTYFGFCMVIFMAALAGVDECYTEVAILEGANAIQTFFYVTLPMIKNIMTLLVINSLIGSLGVFDIIHTMTGGGPAHSTEVASTLMFRTAFQFREYGRSAAMAIILAIITSICATLYFKYAERGGEDQ